MQSVSVIKTNQLVLYTETVYVYSESDTKHINALYEQNVEFVNVRSGGA
jgi:hypothetical protein